MKSQFYAHSGVSSDGADWQLLVDHLQKVAQLAANNAQVFKAHDLAYVIGLLHDLGKYSQAFQERLCGSSKRADHATAGAQIVVSHCEEIFGKQGRALGKLLAFAIAGHHAGLANGVDDGDGRSTLKQRLALRSGQDIPALDKVWEQEIQLPTTLTVPKLKPSKHAGFELAFLARMLFSCLIDADRLDTQNYVRKTEAKPPLSNQYPSIAKLQTRLNASLAELASQARPSPINQLRQHILHYVRQQAAEKLGLFSLTVPTGGGKTLTSLAFSLDHALAHQLRRVIYVIPFTSIIEQTAEVFRKALGEDGQHAVIEHHSAFDRERIPEETLPKTKPDYKDKLRLAMESWDAPIVVTTAVQFFESLFSDRPSQCRKLHNIAGSVIVLDEAQTLPLKLLRPIMAAIEELVLNYGCSVVLCTATQPALKKSEQFHKGFEDVRELAPNPAQLFQTLRRTQVRTLGEQSDEQLIEHLLSYEQVLMIVNNRRHARSLYDSIKHEAGAYHLTTAMCAAHRSKTLDNIRQRLKAGLPCRLVATSLIEAGVDVDFPVVYRAEAGLDSIAQAAGRCNREGLRSTEESWLFMFQSPDWQVPVELGQLVAPMRSIVRNYEDVLAPEALQKYFQQVYSDKGPELDSKQILKAHREAEYCDFPFQNIARDFRMIESHLIPIIVPFDDQARQRLEALRCAEHAGALARQLQRYMVQVPKRVFAEWLKIGAVSAIAPERFGGQYYELTQSFNSSFYSKDAGLNLSDSNAILAESLII